MAVLILIFTAILHLTAESRAESLIDRQSVGNDNYDSSTRYRPDSSGPVGGYYPRTVYDHINQNKYLNAELNGREFRPPNVFASPLMSSYLPQQRQYQGSFPGAGGLPPHHFNSAPLMQNPGYYQMGSPLENQYSGGYNSIMSTYGYGGVPSRIGIGETAAGSAFGNPLSSPYNGVNGAYGYNRQSLSYGPQSYFSPYGAQSLQFSPQLSQLTNYQTLAYANQPYGHLNTALGPQLGSNPYQTQPFNNGQYGYNNNYGYNSYNGVNANTGQNGVNESNRDERSYALSTTNNANLAHSVSDLRETPDYNSKTYTKSPKTEEGFYKRNGSQRIVRKAVNMDQSMIE